jgi:serine/threonine protein kinase
VDQATRGALAEGRYVLVRPVAAGGMGRIWEGRDTRLNRTVAIKEVSLDLIPPIQRTEFIERAVNEGRHAAALADHPNIVTVYDVVVEDGAPWTVMQFVRGRSLAGVLESGPMSVEATATLARQMLSALALAHGTGIVHRDVKPPNIMVADSDGKALLTDFGIAKSSGDVSLTRSGMVVGSSPYMAPERHEGEPDGPAADLFSLGVTLFEAVEGYSPFAKESRTGTVTAILVKPLPEMRQAGRLGPVIRALTEKEPGRRPSAEQALALLERPAGTTVPPTMVSDLRDRSAPPVSEAGSAGASRRPEPPHQPGPKAQPEPPRQPRPTAKPEPPQQPGPRVRSGPRVQPGSTHQPDPAATQTAPPGTDKPRTDKPGTGTKPGGDARAFGRPQNTFVRTTSTPAPAARVTRIPAQHWRRVLWAVAIFAVATLLPLASEYRYLKVTGVRNASEKLGFDFSAPWQGRLTAGTNWDPGLKVAVGTLIVGAAAMLLIAAVWPLLAALGETAESVVKVPLAIAIAIYAFIIVAMLVVIIVMSANGSADDTDYPGNIDRIVPLPGAWLLVAVTAMAIVAIVRSEIKPKAR